MLWLWQLKNGILTLLVAIFWLKRIIKALNSLLINRLSLLTSRSGSLRCSVMTSQLLIRRGFTILWLMPCSANLSCRKATYSSALVSPILSGQIFGLKSWNLMSMILKFKRFVKSFTSTLNIHGMVHLKYSLEGPFQRRAQVDARVCGLSNMQRGQLCISGSVGTFTTTWEGLVWH